MTNEEAIKYLKTFHGYDLPIQEALTMAIEALENNDKLAENLQNCLEMYKKKKAEVEALKQTAWIPCSERLPTIGQAVFRTIKKNRMEWRRISDGKYWLL